jgi:glycopeptide antibiotics resistance protein
MIKFLPTIFKISVLFLIVLSIWPGSLLGYLFYRDWSQEVTLSPNSSLITLNHFFAYFYTSLLGFFVYLKNKNFEKIVFGLFSLSVILEIVQFIVPNRSFEFIDLISNILGVTVAYCVIRIYLLFNKI